MAAFLLAPHRPFFTLSALWALLGGLGWLAALQGLLPDIGFMVAAHGAFLILGFAGAASAGFLLTSMPGWTGRPPVQGGLLGALVLAWAAGQAAIALVASADAAGGWPLLGAALLFPALLGGVLAHAIVMARAFRRLWALAVPVGLAAVAAAFVGGPPGADGWLAQHPQAPVLAYALLIAMVGGRSIAGFGRNYLLRSGRMALAEAPVGAAYGDLGSLAVLAGAAVIFVLGTGGWGAAALILAAGTQLWRLRRWLFAPTWHEPLVALLMVGFLWLPIGLLALALARLEVGPIAHSDALHALTMGTMGGMIAAMAGRAAARRVDGALVARRGLVVACGLIWLAALVRLLAPLWPAGPLAGISVAAALWTAGWLVWLLAYLPALRGPVLRPVLSGRSARTI